MNRRIGLTPSFSNWKLLLFVIVSLTVLMLISMQGYIVSKQSTKTIEGQYYQSIVENMGSLSVNLSNYLNYIDDFARTLSNNPDLIDILKGPDANSKKSAAEWQLRKFSEYYHLRLPVNIQVFDIRDEIFAYPSMNAWEERQLQQTVSSFPWFDNRVALDNNFLHWNVAADYHDASDTNVLYVSKNITRNDQSLGLLVIELNGSMIERMLNRAQIDEANPIFLFSGDLETLFHNEALPPGFREGDSSRLGDVYRSVKSQNKEEGSLDIRVSGTEYRLLYKQIASTSWTMVSLIPPYLLHSDSVNIWRMTGILTGISLLFILLFFGVLHSKVTMPLRRLSRLVRHYRDGEEPEPYDYKGFREIETLRDGIFRFLTEIEQQFRTIKQGEREKRVLELQRLQEQMRPHFWHNSLNSLRFLAVLHGDPRMAEAILALSRMLDYTLRHTEVLYSTIEEEKEYALSYIRFQEIRSMKTIAVELELDNRAMQALIPKFTIQPIVENAVVHGFAPPFSGEPSIRIEARIEGQTVVIAIEDNGNGIEPHRFGQLLERKNKPAKRAAGGLSLPNLQQRIKLEYGEPYGLAIESRPNEKTRMEITLPYIQAMEPAKGDAI